MIQSVDNSGNSNTINVNGNGNVNGNVDYFNQSNSVYGMTKDPTKKYQDYSFGKAK